MGLRCKPGGRGEELSLWRVKSGLTPVSAEACASLDRHSWYGRWVGSAHTRRTQHVHRSPIQLLDAGGREWIVMNGQREPADGIELPQAG